LTGPNHTSGLCERAIGCHESLQHGWNKQRWVHKLPALSLYRIGIGDKIAMDSDREFDRPGHWLLIIYGADLELRHDRHP